MTATQRARLTAVLIYHQRCEDSGCSCGWGRRPEHLGGSWAQHVVAVYEQTTEVDRGWSFS